MMFSAFVSLIFLMSSKDTPAGFQGQTRGTIKPIQTLQSYEPTQEHEIELGYVLDLSVAPNGDLAVLEGKSAYIYIWSADGEFIQRIGGPGQGPGELWDMHFLAFGKNRLYLYHMDGFVTVYERQEGHFHNKRSKRHQIGKGFPRAFMTLDDDSLFVARILNEDQNAPVTVQRFDPETGKVRELKNLSLRPEKPRHNVINMDRFDIPVPVGMPRSWAGRIGKKLAYGFSENNHLYLVDGQGKTVEKLTCKLPRYPSDDHSVEMWHETPIAVIDKTPADLAKQFNTKWNLVDEEPMSYYTQFAELDKRHILFFTEPMGGYQMADYLLNGWAILYDRMQNKAIARGPIELEEDARLFCAERGIYLARFDEDERLIVDKVQMGWK